jgi:hypothetical protein
MRSAPGIWALAALLLAASPAGATANLECKIDDANLTFHLDGLAGDHGVIFQISTGTIRLKSRPQALPEEIAFDKSHIIQQWSFGDELRIEVFVHGPTGQWVLDLAILAQRNRNDAYRGRYLLDVSYAGGRRTLRGRIARCEAG